MVMQRTSTRREKRVSLFSHSEGPSWAQLDMESSDFGYKLNLKADKKISNQELRDVLERHFTKEFSVESRQKNSFTVYHDEENVGKVLCLEKILHIGDILVEISDPDYEQKQEEIMKTFQKTELILSKVESPENFEIFVLGVQAKWKVIINITETQVLNIVDLPCKAIIDDVLVTLIKGRIEEQHVDVLVNSTSSNLNLNAGKISQAISLRAGPDLQKDCSTKGILSFDKVVKTRGYNLACKSIFHCLAKEWNQNNSKDSQDVLMKLVSTFLAMAISDNYVSMALPPIACGVLKMPAKISAECIFGAIENYDWSVSHSLKDLHVVVYHPDESVWQEFRNVLDSKTKNCKSPFKGSGGMKITITGSNIDNILKAKQCLLSYK